MVHFLGDNIKSNFIKIALCKTGLEPCSPDGELINLEAAASEPFFSLFSFIGYWGIVRPRASAYI